LAENTTESGASGTMPEEAAIAILDFGERRVLEAFFFTLARNSEYVLNLL
jgi:hypothetical protein